MDVRGSGRHLPRFQTIADVVRNVGYCTPPGLIPVWKLHPLQTRADLPAAVGNILCIRLQSKKIGGSVKKTFIVARNIVGVAGLLLAGYVLVTSIPDMGRYIKISRM